MRAKVVKIAALTTLSLKPTQNQQESATEEKWETCYLTAGKGIQLDFVSDSKTTTSFFKTAGVNHFPTPPN